MGCGSSWSVTKQETSRFLINIKKGVRIDMARTFTRNCHDLGITIHGTFILGLPGETKETIEETIRFAAEMNPHTLQVSIAAPYPGTFLHRQAVDNGWLDENNAELVDERGVQVAPLAYPHLSHREIVVSVEEFYRRFYLRAPKIAAIVAEMLASPDHGAAAPARRRRVLPVPATAPRSHPRDIRAAPPRRVSTFLAEQAQAAFPPMIMRLRGTPSRREPKRRLRRNPDTFSVL